jgi:hypothetical protein
LSNSLSKCSEIRDRFLISKNLHESGVELTKRSWAVLDAAKSHFQSLDGALRRVEKTGRKLEGKELGLSGVVEDYRTRYVLPCRVHAEKLFGQAQTLKAQFEENMVGVNAEHALAAANVYLVIIRAVDEARRAADKALGAAKTALKSSDPFGGDNLGVKSELSRVRTADLFQEAEGLGKNSVDMGYQLLKIRNEWKEYSVLIQQYSRNLDIMRREISGLPRVSEFAKEAMTSADDALRESERISILISELSSRIKIELRMKVTEMQSFSPEEMGNVPRKREFLIKCVVIKPLLAISPSR